ncbi:MAG: hypothetical protein Q9162_003235 [Coniocarpon cinnabarinum]
MGVSQSAPQLTAQSATQELNQQIIDRLRAMELEKLRRQRGGRVNENEYVMVPREDLPPPPYANVVQPMGHDQQSARNIISNNASKVTHPQTFDIHIPVEGSPITNQKASGRCWLFASTNVFRIPLMKRYNLSEFQLSQAYLFFWDKLEKANYFLESVLDTIDEPLDGRLLKALMASPVGDGGQWDMVANLVQKYGLVPHDLYPDAFNAENSSIMSSLITTKLREDAVRLRSLAKSEHAASEKDERPSSSSLAAAKTAMLREIHQILILMLGPPPSPQDDFTWEYTDKDNKYQKLTTTPMAFASSLAASSVVRAFAGTDVHRLFSLVNDPRHAYNTLLTVDRLGNVYGGLPIRYVNVSMQDMKAAAIKTLQAGIPVFFGSDVGKYSDSRQGIMDTSLYDFELGFNVRLGMSKSERLRTGESAMTHAMVLTGVQVEKGSNNQRYSTRWRVENSWSENAGDKGYFVMSDEWMDEFVYQVVVDPNFVSKETRAVLDQEPTVLPLWDPMGALA